MVTTLGALPNMWRVNFESNLKYFIIFLCHFTDHQDDSVDMVTILKE